MSSLGFRLTVWEEPFQADPSFLRGKYYWRGRRGGLQVDCTYEFSLLSVAEIMAGAERRQGFPAASRAHLERLAQLGRT